MSNSPAVSRSPWANCDADVDNEWHRRLVEFERLAHHVQQPLGDQLRVSVVRSAVDEHDEFIAAHAPDRVGTAQCTGEPGGHRDKQPVTGLMAERVVDVLEIVQVEKQRRTSRRGPAAAREQLFDAVHDQGRFGSPVSGSCSA